MMETRYGKGVTNGRPWRIGLDRLTPDDCVQRWPRIVAHIMAESGWLRPAAAAQTVADAVNGDWSNIPWVTARFGGDPLEAMRLSIVTRRLHKDSEHSYKLMSDSVNHPLVKRQEQIAHIC